MSDQMSWSTGALLIVTMSDLIGIFQMLAVLILGAQIKIKAKMHLKETKIWEESKTKILSTVILKAIIHKMGIEKEWWIPGQKPLNLSQLEYLLTNRG